MARLICVVTILCGLAASSRLAWSQDKGATQPEKGEAQSNSQENSGESVREPDVIFLPTPHDVVAKMLEVAKVTKKDVVYDLGCGDGRIVVAAAKKHGARGFGYDIDPERVKDSLENVKKNGVENLVKIQQADIFKLDLSAANVVTLYLLPDLNVRLIPQLEKLKPGSRIVSHDFRMKGVKPDKTFRVKSSADNSVHRVFLWTTPLKKNDAKKKGKKAKKEKSRAAAGSL